MSDGFAGSTTKQMNSVESEIENRFREVTKGQDTSKNSLPHEAPQDLFDSKTTQSALPTRMAAAGDAKEQAYLDEIDIAEQKRTGGLMARLSLDKKIEKHLAAEYEWECDACGKEFVEKPRRCPACGGYKFVEIKK